MPRLKWLEKYRERLLNSAHRQVVFTVPHELNKLWLYNTREMSNLLFDSVSSTLKTFLSDEKQFGVAHPGSKFVVTPTHTRHDHGGWIKPTGKVGRGQV